MMKLGFLMPGARPTGSAIALRSGLLYQVYRPEPVVEGSSSPRVSRTWAAAASTLRSASAMRRLPVVASARASVSDSGAATSSGWGGGADGSSGTVAAVARVASSSRRRSGLQPPSPSGRVSTRAGPHAAASTSPATSQRAAAPSAPGSAGTASPHGGRGGRGEAAEAEPRDVLGPRRREARRVAALAQDAED